VREATLVIVCVIMLAVVGVIVKLLLDDIGEMDTCRYCSASLAPRVTICPHCHRASDSSALRRSVSQSRCNAEKAASNRHDSG